MVKLLIEMWKKHHSAIHQIHIIPIGQVPDGKSWTGLCSILPDMKSGYAVIFWEVNEQQSATFSIPFVKSMNNIKVLHGDATVSAEGENLNIKLPEQWSFAVIQF